MLGRSAILLLSIFIILSLGVWHYARQSANYSYDRLLNSASLSIMEGLHVYGKQVDLDLPYAAFEMMQLADQDKVFYQVLGTQGELITGYADMPLSDEFNEESPIFFTMHIIYLKRFVWLSGTKDCLNLLYLVG